MRSFFLTIIIVSVSSVILLLYYALKQFVLKKRYKQRLHLIHQKQYEDDRIFFQSKLRSLLSHLRSGKLRWMIILSKINSEYKVEVTYSSVSDMVELKDHGRPRNQQDMHYLNRLGIEKCHLWDDVTVTTMPINAKIVTDVVYFIFEQIFGVQHVKNLHIKTSGE